MGATGYIIKGKNGGSSKPQKEVEVTPADGTIDVERVETEDLINFKIKTTYDGYETINCGSGYDSGYFKAINIKFNAENRRYRLVCILNGGSYTPVAEDFAFYYIKFGWRTGGANADHWYIEEYSRRGNGSFVALEQIALNEYNILIHTPAPWAYANIGILKEDKEDNVTIIHFNGASTHYTPTGTIITTDTPQWKNGSPAVWSVIPEVQTPVVGQLGHYYNGDRNLYFYDGYNWHNVYALAQGVASLLATADRPATANEGTIYYDTTEQNLKIYYGGEWKTIVNSKTLQKVFPSGVSEAEHEGMLRTSGASMTGVLQLYYSGAWHSITVSNANSITVSSAAPSSQTGRIYFNTVNNVLYIYDGTQWQPALNSIVYPYSDSQPIQGQLRFSTSGGGAIQVYNNGWSFITGTTASAITRVNSLPSAVGLGDGRIRIVYGDPNIYISNSDEWFFLEAKRINETENQVVTFTDNLGETIAAADKKQIIVTASFGAVSILDFSSVTKEEGKTIEINILSASIIRVKDGATELDLNGCNESIVKAICLSNVWHYYKTCSITEIV